MMETQCNRLLAHLQEHQTINPLQAWQRLGIYRLGARVFDLKRAGHDITRELVPVTNQFGEECRVAQYRIKKGGVM